MKNIKKYICLTLLVILASNKETHAQNEGSQVIINYIRTYAELAIKEMQRSGFPASIKMAQGILETGAGKSDLLARSNNHFGLKCKSNWTGGKVYHDDDARGECFRQYNNAETSFKDHSDYVKSQPRYAALFTFDPDDYTAWAWGLKNAGYATNPSYAQNIIKYVEAYSLNELNKIARRKNAHGLEEYFKNISGSNMQVITIKRTQKRDRQRKTKLKHEKASA